MTEKEKRELKDGVISIFKRFNILDHTATIGGLRDDILRYINSLQEEPVSEKKCMFTKDNYTDEDRMVLCEDCDEKCEYSKKEEPVSESIDFEQELYKAFGQIKDFTLGIAIAKRFYDMGRKHNEPVSEELEEAAKRYATEGDEISGLYIIDEEVDAFKAGAKWQEEHLWKPADGDDLPDIDREVIALLDNGKVVFAHRPPKYWDGKNIITGKVTRNYPKTYDKGGWNIPDTKYWLDVELPKEIEP